MYWNVHLDGLERTHDLIVEREGVFKEAVLAMRMAKLLGYQVATNTTVYKETDVQEIEDMFSFLSSPGLDGHTIAPGYEYDAAKADMVKRLGIEPENFFLTRKMTIEKFAKVEEWGAKFPIFGTPVYLEFLAGQARPHLLGMGDPDPQCARLERPLLPDDRWPLHQLSGTAGKDELGQARRRRWRGARSALRKLHDALRLRAHGESRLAGQGRRPLEDHQVQFRNQAERARRMRRFRPSMA